MADNTNDFKTKLPFVHKAIARWYKDHGRHALPWRNTSDPYAIYISEVMLQQTQVKTVLERYYHPFLKRFPTLKALAQAPKQDVIKLWEGLGYYNRAGNLHAAAQQCMGVLPETIEALMALPGIGRNTAHAIACFAFKTPVPVMEANVRRVLCRAFGLKKAEDKVLWEYAAQLLDTRNAFDYNQAMMDIGSLVCVKRNPCCDACPLRSICIGKEHPEAYPEAKNKKAPPVRKKAIIVVRDKNRNFYLQRRQTRFLNGLYGFLECEASAQSVEFAGQQYTLLEKYKIGVIRQAYSHFTLDGTVYILDLKSAPKYPSRLGLHKVTVDKIGLLPLSRADSKVVEMIMGHLA